MGKEKEQEEKEGGKKEAQRDTHTQRGKGREDGPEG